MAVYVTVTNIYIYTDISTRKHFHYFNEKVILFAPVFYDVCVLKKKKKISLEFFRILYVNVCVCALGSTCSIEKKCRSFGQKKKI